MLVQSSPFVQFNESIRYDNVAKGVVCSGRSSYHANLFTTLRREQYIDPVRHTSQYFRLPRQAISFHLKSTQHPWPTANTPFRAAWLARDSSRSSSVLSEQEVLMPSLSGHANAAVLRAPSARWHAKHISCIRTLGSRSEQKRLSYTRVLLDGVSRPILCRPSQKSLRKRDFLPFKPYLSSRSLGWK